MLPGLLLLAAAGAAPATGAPGPAVVRHDARLTFDLARHEVRIVDTVSVATAFPDTFRLDPRLTGGLWRVGAAEPERMARPLAFFITDPDSAPPARPTDRLPWPADAAALDRVRFELTGAFHESTEGVVFSRENVGREIGMTIGEEGVYLAADAHWLPAFGDALVVTRLTIDTPAGWEPVTNGVRVAREESGGRLVTVWEEANPVDGVALVANRYHVTEERCGDVAISTWLLREDPDLAAKYLERTRAYLAMYERMIGPYPFGKFATVENWFPTGYGFPSWTLLGGAVMRLPFIPYTSFGHEIAHNWWGNSVYVADEGGNWCEGLTSYCADYRYKEQESAAAAREYRRNLLKDYEAYVRDPARDLPLARFRERHSGATRAVGYGKAMMVFHMVDRAIGRGRFEQALRDVYAARRFAKASWDDFFAAFAAASGRDFATFREQWLTRAGAPWLTLEVAESSGDRVRIALAQGAPPYALDVPVVVTTARGTVDTTVRLERLRDEFEIVAPGAVAVAIDPDHHLFRRLHPQEIEPTISQVLGAESPLFVLPEATGPALDAAEAFARDFAESDQPMTVGGGLAPADVTPGSGLAKVLLNPQPAALQERLARLPKGQLTVAGDLAFVAGQRFSLREHDLVFAAADPHDRALTDLVVICRSPDRLPGLASRVGHYGKYSYLVFPAGQGEVAKGNWPAAGSPLTARLGPGR